jgi:3-methyladenine DNA glycosylase Tag
MSAQEAKAASAWFDEALHAPIIAEKARRAESFLAAMADGRIEESEIKAQEDRLVHLMREIEPQLAPRLHDQITELLCELTVYDFMQAMCSVEQARPKSVFRG